MAGDNRHLNIILDLQDRASASLKGFQGRLQQLQPTFQKMALVGTAAFAGIAAGVGASVKEAAAAEGAYNKFNTVFADGSEEMLQFVKTLRKEMPTATHEIVRLAADMQDLLVPMGLSRDLAQDMSQGFLDVANKIAAFNDVAPTEVLEAIKSGLAGSAEPLKRFGVNALESALEVRAMNMGLLEAGQTMKDVEPQLRAQIRAQALLAQVVDNSSDAISGFAENNDSFIRRQQELQATIKEVKETLGKAFLPIIDSVLKKILPVVQKLGEWIQENPRLAKAIIFVTGAVAGLVAIAGVLGIVMATVSVASLGFALVIAGLIAIGILLVANWDKISKFFKKFWQQLKDGANNIAEAFKNVFTGIANFFSNIWQGIADTFTSIWDTITNTFQSVLDFLSNLWSGFWNGLINILTNLGYLIIGIIVSLLDLLIPQWREYLALLVEAWQFYWNTIKEIFITVWNAISQFFTAIWEAIKVVFVSVFQFILQHLMERFNKIKNVFVVSLNALKELWMAIWNGIKDFFAGIWDAMAEKAKSAIDRIKSFLEPIVDMINKVIDGLQRIGKNVGGKIKDFFGGLIEKGRQEVGDAIISPNGNIITTHPKDYLIATKKPGELAGGNGLTVVINGGIFGQDAPEELGNMILEKLKLGTQV